MVKQVTILFPVSHEATGNIRPSLAGVPGGIRPSLTGVFGERRTKMPPVPLCLRVSKNHF
jgi:hypothetical protein